VRLSQQSGLGTRRAEPSLINSTPSDRSEGYRLDCSGATVSDNEIGPSGQSYNEGPIADGLSLSCANSRVTGNTIFDATGACATRRIITP